MSVYFDSPAAGSGSVVLRASFGGTALDDGTATVYVANAVVSDPPTRTELPNAVGLQTTFTVQNTAGFSTLYYFTVSCGSPVVNCTLGSPASATIAAGQALPVVVNFGTNAATGTGSLTLAARINSSSGPIIDSGTQSVIVQGTGVAMTVDVASVNPGAVLARGQCLAVAIGSAAASECGDLRIVHPLPTVRTMSTWRTPTLVYNSAHAHPWVNVLANVGLPATGQVPTSVTAVLKTGGVQRASGTWTGSQWNPGATRVNDFLARSAATSKSRPPERSLGLAASPEDHPRAP